MASAACGDAKNATNRLALSTSPAPVTIAAEPALADRVIE
jgi:hypothetical protein